MPELSGSLRDFPLAEVIALLTAGKKTGVLKVEGTAGGGVITFSEGQIVHHADQGQGDGTESLVDTLVRLARTPKGVFAFQAGVASVATHEARHDAATVLSQLNERLLVWSEVEASIGSTHDEYVVSRVPDEEAQIELLGVDWNVLASLGAGASAHDIAERFELDEFEVAEAFGRYLEAGLIEPRPAVGDRAPAFVGGDILLEPRYFEEEAGSEVILDLTDSAAAPAEPEPEPGDGREAPASELAARWRDLRASRS